MHFLYDKHISDSATGNYVNSEDFVFYGDPAGDGDNSNTFNRATTFPDATNQTLITDGNGAIEGAFIVPNNDGLKFRTGTREFKLMDITGTDESFAGTVAKTSYTASGLIDTKQGSYHSTRILTVEGAGNIYPKQYYGGDDGGDDGGGGGGGGADQTPIAPHPHL